MKWDLTNDTIEHGTWIKTNLYPMYCSISPNGRFLCYFVHRGWASDEPQWDTCFIVSKLPWLKALCTWETSGDVHVGSCFYRNNKIGLSSVNSKEPFHGNFRGTIVQRVLASAIRRNGWEIHSIFGAYFANDFSFLRAEIQIGGPGVISKTSHEGRFRLYRKTYDTYKIQTNGRKKQALNNVCWADWDHSGRLLVATEDGFLQARDMLQDPVAVTWEYDLRDLTPDPAPAPDWAQKW